MESQGSASKLSERTVLRRGLMAGLAGLGAAAMLKVTGPGKAQTIDGNSIVTGNNAQTSQNETRLTGTPPFLGSVFQVVVGATSPTGSTAAITGSGSGSVGVLQRRY